MTNDPGNLKGRSAPSLLTDEGIEAWVAANDPGGEQKLRTALALGQIGGARARYVQEWIDRRDAMAHQERQTQEEVRSERSISATESQASSAKWTNRMSFASLLVSIAALALAAFAYFLPRAS